VFLGTLISTAVLTGALIIGDSVKLSLKNLVDVRLGNTKFALHSSDRFFRSQLAAELSQNLNAPVTGMLMLDGIASSPDGKRINNVQVNGVGMDFWELFNIRESELTDNEAIIGKNVADKLNLVTGDEFILRVENADVVPLNAPFSQDDKQSVAFRVKVRSIAAEENAGRFSLKSNQSAPLNVFVNSTFLAGKLELQDLHNVMLVPEFDKAGLDVGYLNDLLKKSWTLKDAGVEIRDLESTNEIELYSNRVFIDNPVSRFVGLVDYDHKPLLTYLVNSIRFNERATPYSFVSAVTDPFIPSDLKEDEIIINDWLATDLGLMTGDLVILDYYVIGPLRKLNEESKSFVVRDIIRTGANGIDKTFMPDYPGMADAGSCSDWNTGIPIDLDRIRDKDEKYWDDFRGTPKALISLQTGLQIWSNDFGKYTAFRFEKDNFDKMGLESGILNNLNPIDLNLTFKPVYQKGLAAADNSVDFGGLFLSLSFFVILAAILLTVLLHGLNTESRKEETGVLTALGYSKKRVILIRLQETFLVTFLGSIAGAGVGILYNQSLMAGINSIWQDIVRTDMISVYVLPSTLAIGSISGLLIAVVSIYLVTRKKLKNPVSGLLKNSVHHISTQIRKKKNRNKLLLILSLAGTGILLMYSFQSVEENAGLFLSAGAMFLFVCITIINLWLTSYADKVVETRPDLLPLALKNTGRNKTRSILTITLLAIGTFTIIITGANRKTFYGAENDRNSGTGGFLYWVETSMPLIYDLNTNSGKEELGLDNEPILDNTSFLQFYTLDGDDASCLNLNQVAQPRILGLESEKLNSAQAFSFARLLEDVDENQPWLALKKSYGENIIPAIADQTVLTWGLMKKVGDTLIYLNEKGVRVKLLLVGGLKNSIFQGNLLIDESHLREHFPSVAGSKVMLVDDVTGDNEQMLSLLDSQLTDYGITISSTSGRLAEFNSVTNTYLAVFMILGGLGVILGTFGLGIVMVRNLMERRNEIALLLAIGFRKKHIIKLVYLEGLFVLVTGILCGILAAVIGILPSLLSPAFTIPGSFLFVLVLAVFFSGIIWIWMPAKLMTNRISISVLRQE